MMRPSAVHMSASYMKVGAPRATGAVAEGSLLYALNENDIILGRGVQNVKHVGNNRFRQMVRSRSVEYSSSKSNGDKGTIARQIARAVRDQGGRFVRRAENSTVGGHETSDSPPAWIVVDDATIFVKVKQSFRDYNVIVRKSVAALKAATPPHSGQGTNQGSADPDYRNPDLQNPLPAQPPAKAVLGYPFEAMALNRGQGRSAQVRNQDEEVLTDQMQHLLHHQTQLQLLQQQQEQQEMMQQQMVPFFMQQRGLLPQTPLNQLRPMPTQNLTNIAFESRAHEALMLNQLTLTQWQQQQPVQHQPVFYAPPTAPTQSQGSVGMSTLESIALNRLRFSLLMDAGINQNTVGNQPSHGLDSSTHVQQALSGANRTTASVAPNPSNNQSQT